MAQVLQELPELERVVTMTTRKPRRGEKNGKDYNFISSEEFRQRREKGEFLEWAVVHGESYATPRRFIEEKLAQGAKLIVAVDVQGASEIKKKMREAFFVFIAPPSLKELEERLKRRGTEDRKDIAARITAAKEEMAHTNWYDCIVINKRVRQAANDLLNIIKSQL